MNLRDITFFILATALLTGCHVFLPDHLLDGEGALSVVSVTPKTPVMGEIVKIRAKCRLYSFHPAKNFYLLVCSPKTCRYSPDMVSAIKKEAGTISTSFPYSSTTEMVFVAEGDPLPAGCVTASNRKSCIPSNINILMSHRIPFDSLRAAPNNSFKPKPLRGSA
jgi:hypothetical protein